MGTDALKARSDVAATLRFMSGVTLLLCGLGVPIALAMDGGPVALLMLLFAGVWQLVCAPIIKFIARAHLPPSSRLRQRPTRAALLFLPLAAVCYILSVRWNSNVAYLTTALTAGVIVCSFVHPRVMLGGTAVEPQAPKRVYAREPFAFSVAVRNDLSLVGAFGLTVNAEGSPEHETAHIAHLGAGGERRIRLHSRLPRRGLHGLPPVRVRTVFPFGLVRTLFETRNSHEVLVWPQLVRLDAEVARRYCDAEWKWFRSRRVRDQQGDFRSLRQYRDGDNPRHIHWPTSARLQSLHVQQFDRREMQSVMILLDAYAPDEAKAQVAARRERFERAVSFAASLAVLLTDRGIPFAFASCCPDPVLLRFGTGQRHLCQVLDALALAAMTRDHPPGQLTAMARNDVANGAAICLVSPGPTDWDVLSLTRKTSPLGDQIIDISKADSDGFVEFQN